MDSENRIVVCHGCRMVLRVPAMRIGMDKEQGHKAPVSAFCPICENQQSMESVDISYLLEDLEERIASLEFKAGGA